MEGNIDYDANKFLEESRSNKYKKDSAPVYRVVLDAEQVERLAALGTPLIEIAKFFNCDHKTIDKNYREAFVKGRSQLNERLRQAQLWKAIEEHNPALLIWLGKQYLGQRDKIDSSNNVNITLSMITQVEQPILDDDSTYVIDGDNIQSVEPLA